MVDVDSAMRASAYGSKRRKKSEEDKDKEKQSRVLEPFDPAAAAKKETAEAYSMWIVIIYGLSVCMFMRYIFMPTLTEPTRALWLLPMLLIVTIPSLHKIMIPTEYYEIFTMGNWFRAGFLYFFSFIALSFMLANPPLATSPPRLLQTGSTSRPTMPSLTPDGARAPTISRPTKTPSTSSSGWRCATM